MPKIALRYVGKDENEIRRLKPSNGVRFFEPIDAKEVLANEDREYEQVKEANDLIGIQYGPLGAKSGDGKDLGIPQLQGNDSELQTGLSAEKYGRSQVVSGIPDMSGGNGDGYPAATADRPMTTSGEPLQRGSLSEHGAESRMGHEAGVASENMNKDQLKEALNARGIQFKASANREELAELLDKSGAHK